ncbi:hypothetical protein M1145_01020, partial [Patescibacteria group bacterium]|nr:hypothetical protein [Patescibacteria group bacterium]
MKKLFLHVGIFLVVYILFTGSIFASNISVPFKTFNVGSSGGRITSGNISITYPKNDFVNGTKIILSPVLNQFLPEYVPNIREAFSISIGSDGPLNSQDYTIAHPIKIYVSGAHLSDIYIWDAIRIKWYLLDNLNKSNNIISGESLMRGGTFIVTSAEVSSQFASSSAK